MLLFVTSQAKSIQTFVGYDITKNRFNNRHPMTANQDAFVTIDSMLRPICIIWSSLMFENKGNLSTFEHRLGVAIHIITHASVTNRFTRWTYAYLAHWVEVKLTSRNHLLGMYWVLCFVILMTLSILYFC